MQFPAILPFVLAILQVINAAHPPDTVQLIVPDRKVIGNTSVSAGVAVISTKDLLSNITVSYELPNGTRHGLIGLQGCDTGGGGTSLLSTPIEGKLVYSYLSIRFREGGTNP